MKEELRWIQSSLRQRNRSTDIRIHIDPISPIKHQNLVNPKTTSRINTRPPELHLRAFSPLGDMNSSNSRLPPSSNEHSKTMRTANGANSTIRSVPSDSLQLDTRSSGEEPRRSLSKPDSPMPHSTSLPQLNGSRAQPPLAWQNPKQLGIGTGVVRKMSSEFGHSKPYTGAVHVVENGSPSTSGDSPSQESNQEEIPCTCGHVCRQSIEGGKSTSAFIERIMGERDHYKRELAAERLRSREANDALDFAKAKMEKIAADHDTDMHEATINKTLLKRKERQLEDMKGKIDIERQRAEAASEQEKVWKRDLDTLEAKCRKKVEDAESYAAMMEAQNNTMVKHWKKKQADIDKREAAMLKTHDEFLLLVRKEGEKSKRLVVICDQYRAEIDRASEINQAQYQAHEKYKVTTEESLQEIKLRGTQFGEQADFYLKEASELRDKLAWSLQVSKEFRDLPSAVDDIR